MLVLSRKKNESIVINNDITIVVVEIRGDKVRLGVEAPMEVPVHRKEVWEAIYRNALQVQQLLARNGIDAELSECMAALEVVGKEVSAAVALIKEQRQAAQQEQPVSLPLPTDEEEPADLSGNSPNNRGSFFGAGGPEADA